MVRIVAIRRVLAVLAAMAMCAPAVRADADSSPRLGLIFGLASPLQALQPYAGGVGLKAVFGSSALRAGLTASYSSSTDSEALQAETVYEYHLAHGTVSPYVGVLLGGGYQWTAPSGASYLASAGAVAGGEVFLTRYLSVFAEYGLRVDFTFLAGPAGSPAAVSWVAAAGMGNHSMIGVVLYLGEGASP